uniref:Uncharacterized protein n=1 Tax=Leptobrachium leishanense TaxID=445787 RepID=A0A8C5MYW3_9ANUR
MYIFPNFTDVHLSDDDSSRQTPLRGLTTMSLTYSNLTDLPTPLLSLAKLLELDLSYNNLRTLPNSIRKLKNLTVLSVKSNQIVELPRTIGRLTKLTKLDLSENKLWSLPEEIANLQSCTDLDVSRNRITKISQKFCELKSLKQLNFQCNWLDTVPDGLHSLPRLSFLNLKNNRLQNIPKELQSHASIHLEGNIITQSKQSHADKDPSHGLQIERIFINKECGSFSVTSAGCRVFLQCGVQIYFPPRAVSSTITITFKMLPADHPNMKLGLFDVLLSRPLELEPHGVTFNQEVEIDILCTSPCTLPNHVVTMRTFDGKRWTDVPTISSSADFPQMWVSCKTRHFSLFCVVSRLVEESFEVPAEGTVFQSRVEAGIVITFPPGVTKETRVVRVQVMPVKADLVRKITDDPNSRTSSLLCLSQDTEEKFLGPITIQLPLSIPPEAKRSSGSGTSKFFALHGDEKSQTWTDMTKALKMETKDQYAEIEVDHFSIFLIGYISTSIMNFIRTLVKLLRTYHVNFIVMQKKDDKQQVLVQCVPKDKVKSTLEALESRYDGPRHSDRIDLIEGEEFFASFELGINIHAARPDIKDNKLSFIFRSHLDNIKEVHVKSSPKKEENPVRGQVSFYRGLLHEYQTTEASSSAAAGASTSAAAGASTSAAAGASTSAAAAGNNFLASLPITVPNTFARASECLGDVRSSTLKFGSDETGYLNENHLMQMAEHIGNDWRKIAIHLGVPQGEQDNIKQTSGNVVMEAFDMLKLWSKKNCNQKNYVRDLKSALAKSGRRDMEEFVKTQTH